MLKAKDLIPVLSWLSTKGTCRYCGEKVSIQYPLIELLTAFLTTGAYLVLGFGSTFLWSCFLLWTGIVITFIDIKYEIIPDHLNFLLGIGGLLFWGLQVYTTKQIAFTLLLGSLLGGGFLLFLAIVSSMGGGDIKYMTAAGLFLGPLLTLVALYIAFILGGIYALLLIVTKQRKKGMHIPFGPYLVIGVVTAFVFGPQIIDVYMRWSNF
jgi:leader peptidase (prepilin peptidase)/N-methyltransferase